MASFRKVKRIGGGIAAFAVVLVLSVLVVAPLAANAATSNSVVKDSSALDDMTFTHIDVKTAAAVTGEQDLGTVSAIKSVSYTNEQGATVYFTGSFDDSNGEWTSDHTGSTSFDSSVVINVTFVLKNGESETEYTSTLTSSTTYPNDTYYPSTGANAYKLYNYLTQGNNVSEREFEQLSIEAIDISGMSVYLVSAIVCDSSTVSYNTVSSENGGMGGSGSNGLDLVLNVATLLEGAPGVSITVEKTLIGADKLTAGQFEFVLAEASVSDGVWTSSDKVVSLETTGDFKAADQDYDTVTDSVIGATTSSSVSYASGADGIYYYILTESIGTDDGIEYDDTVYGIRVEVTTTESITGTVTTYTTSIESVTTYTLKMTGDGTYEVSGVLSEETATDLTFSFTNEVIDSSTTDDDNEDTEETEDPTDPDDGDDTEAGDETDDGDDAATTTDDGSSDTDDSTDTGDADADDDADDADADDASTLPSTGDMASLVALGSAVAAGAAAVAGGVHLRRKRQ